MLKNKSKIKSLPRVQTEEVIKFPTETVAVDPIEMVEKAIICVLTGDGEKDADLASELTMQFAKKGYRTVSSSEEVKAVITVSTKFDSDGYKLTISDKKVSAIFAEKLEKLLLEKIGLKKSKEWSAEPIGKVPAMIGFDYKFDKPNTSDDKIKRAMKLVCEQIVLAFEMSI